ncbi:MAG TPA: hypothetical protein VFR09_08955 [Alphaproteobacteria bacterium]|nr:hypothetical protein [Alphaproteobacteria bacterium]
MKAGYILGFLVFVLLLAGGGLVALARAPMMPPVQKVEQVIPDDHIPR